MTFEDFENWSLIIGISGLVGWMGLGVLGFLIKTILVETL